MSRLEQRRGAFALLLILVVASGFRLTGSTRTPVRGDVAPAQRQASGSVDPSLLKTLRWRSIGPAVFGGRVTDVAGVAGNPNIVYVAHASGGLFKSLDGGIRFESIFESGNTLSIGAIAVSPSNPDVVYVGTGEGNPRNSASFGDGVYRSTDGGKTWKHLGLENTERFARLAVNPRSPNVVFAAALGHEWGPNEERGLYRSTNGGETWTRVLYTNPTTGASDVCFDPRDPNIVYAAMYDYLRRPWHFRSGGPGSGLYRSTDGGESWVKLTDPTRANGLHALGEVGRIGLAVSQSEPAVVYAVIESASGNALWRSGDRAEHWTKVNATREVNARPFYFSRIAVDPSDSNRVYSLARSLFISTNGGHDFAEIDYWRIFGDMHAMWIDPRNPSRVLAGSDGGFYISNDRGEHWWFVNTQPFAQAYRVAVDMAEPYNVLGGFQDHEVWRGPNERWNTIGVVAGDWRRLREYGDGSSVLADPRDPNIVYYAAESGDLTRVDMRTGEERYISPYPVAPTSIAVRHEKYRFSWTPPLEMSPTRPDVLYFGGNVVFRTSDAGSTWTAISPDLTTNDIAKQELSGGITPDNSRAESHCTITTLSESPRDPLVLWAGTDDGNLQLTRDGGKSWTNVAGNIEAAPRGAWFSAVSASRTDAATAYVAIDNHRLDDFAPYVFVTRDYGRTWAKLGAGLRGYVHVVKEDPREPAVLYAGTELGIFASFDRGAHWTDLRLGLPPLPVYDLTVHPRDNDLVIATHGRGFYILDDITPLQGLALATGAPVTLFPPTPAVRYTPVNETSSLGSTMFVAANKPYGAAINYFVSPAASGKGARIRVIDDSGNVVRTLDGPAEPGINRIVWSLRKQPCGPPGRSAEGVPIEVSARVVPGTYNVRLEINGHTSEQALLVRPDPRSSLTAADVRASYEATDRLVTMECQAQAAMDDIDAALRRMAEGGQQAASASRQELEALRDVFVSDPRGRNPLNLMAKISTMRRQVGEFSGPPTAAQRQWIETYDTLLQQALKRKAAVGTSTERH